MSDPIQSSYVPRAHPADNHSPETHSPETHSTAIHSAKLDQPVPQQPLPYATANTPMLSPSFPSPKLTAWVMLAFSMFSTVGGTVGVGWIFRNIMDSDQPIGAFACVPVPIVLLLAMMIGLIRETYLAFRRAYRRS